MLTIVTSPSEEEKRLAMQRLSDMVGARRMPSMMESPLDRRDEICAVIALRAPKPIFAIAHWFQRPGDIPLFGHIGGWSGPTNDHPFYIETEQIDLLDSDVADLLRRYGELEREVIEKLRAPLLRLNQSRRSLEYHTVEAAAIDLGTALESLLTGDRDSNAPISYLLRVRGALMLGGDFDEKRSNFSTLRAVYDLRSQAVHKGVIVDLAESARSTAARQRLMEVQNQLRSGVEICKRILTKIIIEGRFPNWDSLVLGEP
jgi:hypothetical protein